MNRYFNGGVFSFLSIIVLMTFFHNSNSEAMTLSGTLVYGQANSIFSFDLANSKRRTVYEEKKDFSMFQRLSKIDNENLLVEDSAYNFIKTIDLATGAVETLRSGNGPVYISSHKKVLFYDVVPEKSKIGLFIADINSPEKTAVLIHEGPFSIPTQVIQVSKDEVVFYYDKGLWKYNIHDGKTVQLEIENCSSLQVFRLATKQLLCFDSSAQRYFLSDIEGNNVESISVLKPFSSAIVVYVSDDVLIFSKARFQFIPLLGEVRDLWVYDFKNGDAHLLKENVPASLGSVVLLSE